MKRLIAIMILLSLMVASCTTPPRESFKEEEINSLVQAGLFKYMSADSSTVTCRTGHRDYRQYSGVVYYRVVGAYYTSYHRVKLY